MRRKVSKKYIIAVLIGILLTPSAVSQAYEARQAFHFGGEWLLVPLAILMGLVADSFKDLIKEVKNNNERS